MLLAAALKQLDVIHVQLRLDVDQAVALRWLLVILVARLQVVVADADQAVALKWLLVILVLLRPAIAVADVVRRRAAAYFPRSSPARRSLAAMPVHAMHVQLLAAPARHLLAHRQLLALHQLLHHQLQLQLSIQVLT